MNQKPTCTVATRTGCGWCDKLKSENTDSTQCKFVDCAADASHPACVVAQKAGGYPTTVCTLGDRTETLSGYVSDWQLKTTALLESLVGHVGSDHEHGPSSEVYNININHGTAEDMIVGIGNQ